MITTSIRILCLALLAALFFCMVNVTYPMYVLNEMSYDTQRILELLFLGIIGIWLIIDIKLCRLWLVRYQALPLYARLGILIFFAIGLASSLEAKIPRLAFLETGVYFFLLVALFCMAALRQHYQEKFDHTIIAVLALTLGVYGVYLLIGDVGYWYFGIGSELDWQSQLRLLVSPGFQNIRFLMSFISVTLAFVVLPSLWYPNHPKWARGLYFLLSVLWWYAMVLNHGRTLWLEWGVMIVVIPLLFRGMAWPWLKQHCKAALTGFVLYEVLAWGATFFAKPGAPAPVFYDDDVRLTIWWDTLKMAWHHPLLGVGPMHFSYYFRPYPWPAHPHNTLLLIAAEWGIAAVLILLGLVIWAICAWLKLRKTLMASNNQRQSLLYVALSAAVIGGGIDGLLNGTLVIAVSQLPIALIAGWMIGWYHSQIKPADMAVSMKAQGVFIVLLLSAAVLTLYGLFPLVLHLPETVQNFVQIVCVQQQQTCILAPHFWAEGFLTFYVF